LELNRIKDFIKKCMEGAEMVGSEEAMEGIKTS